MFIELQENINVEMDIYNGRTIFVKCSPKYVKVIKILGVITELRFLSNFSIGQGDIFPLISECDTKTLYHVREIKEIETSKDEITFLIACEKINKTTHWILPLLGKGESFFGYDDILINAYVGVYHPEYNIYNDGSCIFLKYRYLKYLDPFFKNLTNHPQFIWLSKHYSPFEYLYVFRIPNEFRNDRDLLILGEYSKISEPAKKQILKFHGLGRKGETYSILYKPKEYLEKMQKDLGIHTDLIELESKFNLKQETL